MRSLITLALLLSLALPGVAAAQESSLASLEQQHQRLSAHQGRLEGLLSGQVARIGRLKAQPAGVRRDFQLNSALRDNQQLATRLNGLQQQLRAVREQLARAYRDALARATTAERRRELRDKLRALAREAGRETPRIVTDGQATALDSAEDLEEKADLLADSREKVRRQLVRVRRRLSRLERRVRLERHGRAVDDTPFDETSMGRVASSRPAAGREAAAPATGVGDGNRSSAPPTGKLGGDDDPTQSGPGETGTPTGSWDYGSNNGSATVPPGGAAPPTTGSGGDLSGDRSSNGGGGETGGFGGAQTLTLQQALEPSLLVGPASGGLGGGDLRGQIQTLRQAESQLNGTLRSLSSKAAALRKKAETLRKRPR